MQVAVVEAVTLSAQQQQRVALVAVEPVALQDRLEQRAQQTEAVAAAAVDHQIQAALVDRES